MALLRSTLPYRVRHSRSAGLVVLVSAYGQQLWSLGFIRGRPKRCEITRKDIPVGSLAYSPLTNGNNRMHRISHDGMVELCRAAGKIPPRLR